MEHDENSTSFEVRQATADDALAVAALMSRIEEKLGSAPNLIGGAEALEYIDGVFDEVESRVLLHGQRLVGFVDVQMDPSRRRHFADAYAELPDAGLNRALRLAVDLAAARHPDWEFWVAINSRDGQSKRVLADLGFSSLRTYWSLEAPLTSTDYPTLRADMRMIQVRSLDEFRVCHEVQQDAFSRHFGSTTRSFDEWYDRTVNTVTYDPDGIFMLEVGGTVVGFAECTDRRAHRSAGYIHGLGVRQVEQGKGFGRLLLLWAMAYCRERGFGTVQLNVDTGNESGALRLYESVGLRPFMSWEQWHRVDWSTLASANLAE